MNTHKRSISGTTIEFKASIGSGKGQSRSAKKPAIAGSTTVVENPRGRPLERLIRAWAHSIRQKACGATVPGQIRPGGILQHGGKYEQKIRILKGIFAKVEKCELLRLTRANLRKYNKRTCLSQNVRKPCFQRKENFMSKLRNFCQVCINEVAIYYWDPFTDLLDFKHMDEFEDVLYYAKLGVKCKLKIVRLCRENPEAFNDCKTLRDVLRTVREEIKS